MADNDKTSPGKNTNPPTPSQAEGDEKTVDQALNHDKPNQPVDDSYDDKGED